MKKAAFIFILLVAAAAGVFLLLRPGRHQASDSLPRASGQAVRGLPPAGPVAPAPRGKPPELQRLEMARELNAPGKTIRDDLVALDGVFLAYQTNFLKEGNPVGTNKEITEALTGRNSLGLAFIDPEHPAINDNGELCDRWGTPFFFHQVSAGRMEIVSAGPDRDRGTADDVTIE